jgi:hypothetical protein
MKLFTNSNEVFEVELFGVADDAISALEFGLYPQQPNRTNSNGYNLAPEIVKDLNNGIALLDGVATVTLEDTDIVNKGLYFVEMRYTDLLTGQKSNLEIRPNKVTFTQSRLANN